jgi:predicted  nucleic acid-binding Zn-ribbon protein
MSDSLHRLLDLQDRDLHADQLRHRRASLPERAALADGRRALAELDAARPAVVERLGALERSQRRLEDEVASLVDKQAVEGTKLYSGTVTSPRELQAMQDEIATLARRQGMLEDELLEIMEQTEPVQAELAELDRQRGGIAFEIERVSAALAEAETVVDGELEGVEGERQAIAAELPDELLATYEKLRARLGGVAVARLEGSQCLGCHLSLPATEVDTIRHAAPDAVVTHEECGRILVR